MINSVKPLISANTPAAKDLLLPDDLEPFLFKLQPGQFGFGGQLPASRLIEANEFSVKNLIFVDLRCGFSELK